MTKKLNKEYKEVRNFQDSNKDSQLQSDFMPDNFYRIIRKNIKINNWIPINNQALKLEFTLTKNKNNQI